MNRLKKIAFIALVAFLLFSLTRNIFTYQKTLFFYNALSREYTTEKEKNINLRTQILKKRDQAEVEKTIRNKLNLVKKNEIEILVPKPTPTPRPMKKPNHPIWYQWLTLFFASK